MSLMASARYLVFGLYQCSGGLSFGGRMSPAKEIIFQ